MQEVEKKARWMILLQRSPVAFLLNPISQRGGTFKAPIITTLKSNDSELKKFSFRMKKKIIFTVIIVDLHRRYRPTYDSECFLGERVRGHGSL